MRYHFIAAAAAVALVGVSGAEAKKREVTGLELQQMQARDLEASKSVVFSAVMSVLQDSGYRIGAADKDTGLITAVASTKSKMTWMPFVGFGRSKKTPVVSAYIEERSPRITSVRLNFVMGRASSNSWGSNADEEPITDPAVYTDAFERIQKAVFIRLAADAPVPPRAAEVPVAAAATPPAAVAPTVSTGVATQPAAAPATAAPSAPAAPVVEPTAPLAPTTGQ